MTDGVDVKAMIELFHLSKEEAENALNADIKLQNCICRLNNLTERQYNFLLHIHELIKLECS